MKKQSYEQNITYAAKQLLIAGKEKEQKYFGISGFLKTNAVKNKNLLDLASSIANAGKKVLLVNFDPELKESVSSSYQILHAFERTDSFSYHVSRSDFDPENHYDIVLFNLLPLLTNKAMLERNMFFDSMLLSVKYGETQYRDFEDALEVLRENNIPLLGVLANR